MRSGVLQEPCAIKVRSEALSGRYEKCHSNVFAKVAPYKPCTINVILIGRVIIWVTVRVRLGTGYVPEALRDQRLR